MKRIIITYGAILGVLLAIGGYLYLRSIIGMGLSSLISFGGLAIILVIAGIQYRRSQDGFASFGELLKLFVGVICVGLVISMISSISQITMMDDQKITEMSHKIVDGQLAMYESMGMNEEFLENMEDELTEKAREMLNPTSMAVGSIFTLFIYFLISLIPAAILRKN